MANTVTHFETGMEIVFDGATDLDFATYFPGGILWTGVELSGAPGDTVIFRHKTASGVPIAAVTVDTDTPGIGREKWKEHWVHPYILATDLVLATPAQSYLIVRYV